MINIGKLFVQLFLVISLFSVLFQQLYTFSEPEFLTAPAPAPAPSKPFRWFRLRLRLKCVGSGDSGSGSGPGSAPWFFLIDFLNMIT